MKTNKLFIISITVLAALTLFTGCIIDSSKSTYFEPWHDTEGYVVYTKNQRNTEELFSDFVETNKIPDGEKLAVKWEHVKKEGTSRIWCSFKSYARETNIEEGTVYEFVEQEDNSRSSIKITSTPYENLKGFILYSDDENVYIINDLYKLGYKEVQYARDADVKFVFDVTGMLNLTIYMKYEQPKTRPY